jgi:hypothetical protein
MQKIGALDRYRQLPVGSFIELSAGTHKIDVSTPEGALWYIDSEIFLTATSGKDLIAFSTNEPVTLGCTMEAIYYSPNESVIHTVSDKPSFTKPYQPPERDLVQEAMLAKVADRSARRTAAEFTGQLEQANERIRQLEAGARLQAQTSGADPSADGTAVEGTSTPEQAGAGATDSASVPAQGSDLPGESEEGRGPDNGQA